jgi:Putative Actinobacterial Holin-X, holin superfamily III
VACRDCVSPSLAPDHDTSGERLFDYTTTIGGADGYEQYSRSIPDIFADAANQFGILVRKEAQLVRTEMSEKITDLAIGLGLLVGGSVLLIPAFVILLQAAVAGLVDANIPVVWATLIVGGASLVVGLLLLVIGIVRLKAARPVPAKTIEQLRHDAEMAKQQLRNDYDTPERAA